MLQHNHNSSVFPRKMVETTSRYDRKNKRASFEKTPQNATTEADFQLIMRMFVNIRNKVNIESDERVSKRNYGSRPGCSIEDAILEKTLIFDNSLVTGNHNIYAMTDLQDGYYRKLSNIGLIVKYSAGVETKPIQLVTKILPIMEHYVNTSFGVSKHFCGRRRITLAGTGQGNVFSVNMCRYSSCIMLREIEKENLGVFIKPPSTTDSA